MGISRPNQNDYVFVIIIIIIIGSVQEIGRRTVNITGDARESQLPVPAAVRGTTEGECGLISKHVHQQLARCNPLFHILNVLVPTGFVLVGQK